MRECQKKICATFLPVVIDVIDLQGKRLLLYEITSINLISKFFSLKYNQQQAHTRKADKTKWGFRQFLCCHLLSDLSYSF